MNVCKRSLRSLAHISLIIGSALILGSPGSALAQNKPVEEPRNLAELVVRARAEGHLTIAWSDLYGDADGARKMQEGLKRRYHVDIAIEHMPTVAGAAFVNQIAQEVAAHQTASSDLVYNVGSADIAQYMLPVHLQTFAKVPNVEYYDGRAIALATILAGIVYNTKLVTSADVPRRLSDLLKPQWKGKIATTPYQGLEGRYLGLPTLYGHERMIKFYQQLAPQVGGLIRCGDYDRLSSGEFSIFGIDCGDYAVRLRQRRGEPLAESYPNDGTNLLYYAPGIPITAPHPYAARLLLVYLTTREGQDLLWDVMATDNNHIPGSHIAKVIEQQQRRGVRFVETFGNDAQHPEFVTYMREINSIVNGK